MLSSVPGRDTFGSFKTYASANTNASRNIFVVPGFGEGITHNRPVVDALAAKGFHAFTFSQPRSDKKQMDTRLGPLARQGKVALHVLEQMLVEGESCDAIAHSLGTAAIVQAALLQPKRFKNIILMQPVGLIEPQSFQILMRGALVKQN
jgi:pimeloyl-ACP methyl ester carboxylesterase